MDWADCDAAGERMLVGVWAGDATLKAWRCNRRRARGLACLWVACLVRGGVAKSFRRFLILLRRRYRLKVRTWPSQGQNPGSTPGIATKNLRWLCPPAELLGVPAREIWRYFSFFAELSGLDTGIAVERRSGCGISFWRQRRASPRRTFCRRMVAVGEFARLVR